MKAIGIVRRLDDLGRIVIPKELCRSFGINPGDPVEIFTEDGHIILRKFSVNGALSDTADKLHQLANDLPPAVRTDFVGHINAAMSLIDNKQEGKHA